MGLADHMDQAFGRSSYALHPFPEPLLQFRDSLTFSNRRKIQGNKFVHRGMQRLDQASAPEILFRQQHGRVADYGCRVH
ncbi:hypothetical protein D3C73_1227240 [compost metagenome]